MKLAIMQPYFFPYLGYFQLIHAVDAFVMYDDVNYIKGGWINRNYILSQGKKSRITLQLQGASPNILINQILVGSNKQKLLKTIQQSYVRAPYYVEVMPLVEEILNYEEPNLATFLDFCLHCICDYLGFGPKWYLSSELQKDNSLHGQDKVLAICKELGAKHYINLPGGKELYNHINFNSEGIQLSFIEPRSIEYKQINDEFVPHLSIIDVLMFTGRKQSLGMIKEYQLV